MIQQFHSWMYIQIHSFKFSGSLVLIFETELFIELKDMEFSFGSVKI